jgi:hypothetical protein
MLSSQNYPKSMIQYKNEFITQFSESTFELSESELNNYGYIISYTNVDNFFDEHYNKIDINCDGIRYIFNNLIKPLQLSIEDPVQYFRNRETSSRKSKPINDKIYDKMQIIGDDNTCDRYTLNAYRMNDFDIFLQNLNIIDIVYDFFIKIKHPDNEEYLIKMFYFLKYINNNGIYHYRCNVYQRNIVDTNQNKLHITELRNVIYKYLIIVGENLKCYSINFERDLINFETFKKQILEIANLTDNIYFTKCYLKIIHNESRTCNTGDIHYNIIRNNTIITSSNNADIRELIFRLNNLNLELNKNKYPALLNKYILDIDFISLLKQSIFSYDNKLYYVDNYYINGNLKKLLITYKIETTINLEDKKIFSNNI